MHAAEKNNTPEDSRKMHRSRRGLLAEEGGVLGPVAAGTPKGLCLNQTRWDGSDFRRSVGRALEQVGAGARTVSVRHRAA